MGPIVARKLRTQVACWPVTIINGKQVAVVDACATQVYVLPVCVLIGLVERVGVVAALSNPAIAHLEVGELEVDLEDYQEYSSPDKSGVFPFQVYVLNLHKT